MDELAYSKAQVAEHHPRNLAAKVGIVTGVSGMVLSWAIDMRIIDSDLANSPGLLAAGALAGVFCVAVSWLHFRHK
jgi:hypothetical protein